MNQAVVGQPGIIIHLPAGTHVPLHCTASIKLFLARKTRSQRGEMPHGLNLTRHTDLTIADPDVWDTQLGRIRQKGIVVPAPTARRSVMELRQYLPVMRRAASKMSSVLDS